MFTGGQYSLRQRYKCHAVPFYLRMMGLEPPGVILSDEKQVMSL